MIMEKKLIVRKLGYLHMLHRLSMQSVSARTGLYYGQQPILENLIKNGGCLNQKQIAENIHVSPPGVTAAIKRMQKAGLVVKTGSQTDMRVSLIEVTEKGRQLQQSFKSELRDYDEKMFIGFSEEDCAAFTEYLNRVIRNLNGDPDDEEAFFRLCTDLKEKEHHERKGQNKGEK